MHEIKRLDAKGLREFGLITGAIVAGLFGLFLPWLFDFGVPFWPWILAAVLGLWALIAPATLEPVYRVWMRIGLLLGSVTTPLILGAAFFVVVLPTGVVMRLLGHDPMARKLRDDARTYRVPSRRIEAKNLEKPF